MKKKTFWSRGHFIIGAIMAAMAATPVAQAKTPKTETVRLGAPETIIPLQVDEVIFEDGQLIAIVSVGSTSVEVPVDLRLATEDGAAGADCPVLELELGAIHLDLLGLVVDTSDICLDITAVPGDLLGDLLCAIAGLLDQGGLLEDILGGLTDQQLNQLLDFLTDLLNEVLGLVTSPSAIVGVSGGNAAGTPGGGCDVLNLAVGPLELNLLGLLVELDDCDGGPVTVDITAQPGEGRLLGNLLCSLSRLLDRGASDAAIDRVVNRIIRQIERLLG